VSVAAASKQVIVAQITNYNLLRLLVCVNMYSVTSVTVSSYCLVSFLVSIILASNDDILQNLEDSS